MKGFLGLRGGRYIDCTVGTGSHALWFLEALGSSGRLLGIDLDPYSLRFCEERLMPFRDLIKLRKGNFRDIGRIAREEGFCPCDGVFFDLGLSSFQLASGRGFSFYDDELDMRYDPNSGISAYDVVNGYSEDDLYRVFKRYGEERFSRKIAREIVRRRPIRSARELSSLIESLIRGRKLHPATKVFQAIRIEVNGEIENLEAGLRGAFEVLKPGGRVVVISYHSLEDRVVKKFMREKKALKLLTKKPVRPSMEEIEMNPRSRSARLRAGEKRG